MLAHFIVTFLIVAVSKGGILEESCDFSSEIVVCSNLTLKPKGESPVNSSYKTVLFKNCQIEKIGKDFFDLFPSAEELHFINSNVTFVSPTKTITESPTISNIKKVNFQNSTLGENVYGYGTSSLINLERLFITNSVLEDNDLEIADIFCTKPKLKLKELRVLNSNLRRVSNFECLPNIEILDFTGNSRLYLFYGHDTKIFQFHQRLVHLSIEHTGVGHVDYLPTSLEYLNLRNSSWSYMSALEFLYLLNLKYLDLSDNKFLKDAYFMETFDDLMELEHLNISSCFLDKIEPRLFQGTKKLKELYASRNEFTNIPKGTFDNLKDLEILDLSYNRLQSFDSNLLNSLKKLKTLNLKGNNISKMQKNIFDSFKGLTVIFDKWYEPTAWEKFWG